jgi:DNA invertase Pin-like site-specific DNA recombinase
MSKTKRKSPRVTPLALAYLRVSTEEQAKEGASLDAQRNLLAAEADRRGWDVEFVVDDGFSAKDLNRPGLTRALGMLDGNEADVLLTLRVDRLSRSVYDFADLMSRSEKKGWNLVACDLGIDTSTPHGGLMAHVLASVAEYERRVIGVRTREGMAQRRREGVHVGRPRALDEDLIERIVRGKQAGQSLSRIARDLSDEGIPTARGGAWRASTIKAILASTTAEKIYAADVQ